MTARSRERGSHAAPPAPDRNRHRKPPDRPAAGAGRLMRAAASGRGRLCIALVVLAALVGTGFFTDFGAAPSAEPTVREFLFDWQQGAYAAAARLTSGQPADVRTQLAAAFRDLDATGMFLAMGPISQNGNRAEASFAVTVDLAGGSYQWNYTGKLAMTSRDGRWLVDWAPSVIEPSLKPGDRLAVLTSFTPRAQITDAEGAPLIGESAVYRVGVYPGRLTDARQVAARLSQLTGLNAEQVLGQVDAAPPGGFLSLLTLPPSSFRALWPKLSAVRGLTVRRETERLFNPDPDDAVGQIGTENSRALRDEGKAYQPGATVGLSGLEQAYQDTLAGTPTVRVIVVNAAGKQGPTLWTSPGTPGSPVRTTIESKVQAAANTALAEQSSSGEIAAVDAATGDVVGLAEKSTGPVPLPPGGPLAAKIEPGMAFSIVSAAALLDSGLSPNLSLPCQDVANVGGQTFTYAPGQSSSATLASDFAAGCGTAFATVSLRLTPAQLAAAEKAFGIGAPWNLRVRAFSGSVSAASGEAALAAQAIGTGGVLMSPLSMAMIAAEVDAGVGHTPALLASDPPTARRLPLSAIGLSALRGMMRQAVEAGPAQAANLPGEPVYGQAGVVQTGANAWLSWFVGYRGNMAVSVLETGRTQAQAAAAAAGAFLSAAG